MFKYWISRILGRPAVRFSGPGNAITYYEGRRKIELFGEMMPDGFAIDVASVVSWADTPGTVIGMDERRRIANAAKSVMVAQWGANVIIVGDE